VAVTSDQSGGNRLTLLARAGELLSSPGAGEHTLKRLASMLVAGFARWCAIDVLREDGSMARVATAPHDGPPLRHDGPHGAAVVMRTGEPELVQHVTEEFVMGAAGDDLVRLRVLREMAPKSYMCVPLMARDRPWGAITLIATDRVFDVSDVDLAAELARRAAGAIETGRLVRSLERSEERYRLLFEANPLPMWVYDAGTLQFLAVNEAAVRHYGYTSTEFLSMTITDIRPPEDVEAMLADMEQRGGPGSPMPGAWRHRRKDGSLIDVEITAGKVVFEGRSAALVLAHDVTERRRLGRDHAKAVVGAEAACGDPRIEATLQRGVGGDARADMGAGEIERLGGGEGGDQAVGDLGHGGQGGCVLGAVEDEVAMDFVGNQEQVVLDAEGSQRSDLFGRPDGAARIVRAAKENDLRPGRHHRAERHQVHRVAAIGFDKLRIENAPLVGKNDPAKSMIGRWEDYDLVPGPAECLKNETQPGNDSRRRTHPLRIDLQTMPACHPAGEGGRPAPRVGVVAVDTALHLGRERFSHAGRGSEIHVGDPHRDRIGRLDARESRHVVPLRGMGAATLDNAVEIEHGQRLLDGAWRGHPFKLERTRQVKERDRMRLRKRAFSRARFTRAGGHRNKGACALTRRNSRIRFTASGPSPDGCNRRDR